MNTLTDSWREAIEAAFEYKALPDNGLPRDVQIDEVLGPLLAKHGMEPLPAKCGLCKGAREMNVHDAWRYNYPFTEACPRCQGTGLEAKS